MNPKDIFNKIKSFVEDALKVESSDSSGDIKALEYQKVNVLKKLFSYFPEQMSQVFWNISTEYSTWGKPREWTVEDIYQILENHILSKPRFAKYHTYSNMLCKVADYWVVSEITGMEESISYSMINMKLMDTLEVIPGVNTISKLQKEDETKPGLVIYYFSTSNQVIFPYFHFVD